MNLSLNFDEPPQMVPGPESSPDDRGECLILQPSTMTRCTGRRIASREYLDGQGWLVRWTCDKCGVIIVV